MKVIDDINVENEVIFIFDVFIMALCDQAPFKFTEYLIIYVKQSIVRIGPIGKHDSRKLKYGLYYFNPELASSGLQHRIEHMLKSVGLNKSRLFWRRFINTINGLEMDKYQLMEDTDEEENMLI
jgi:hypothetical protein